MTASLPPDPLGLQAPFDLGGGRTGRLVSLPALERRGFGAGLAAAGLAAHRAGVAGPPRRRPARHRGRRPRAGRLAPHGRADARAPLRGGAGPPAGLHRRAAAGGPGRHAGRGGPAGAGPRAHRADACRWTWWSTTRSRWTPGAAPTRSASTWRWSSQRNRAALPVPQVGGAGLPDLPHRPARLRHLPPGQPGAPGRGVFERDGLWFPDTLVGTDSPHHHGERPRRGRPGAWAASRPRRPCWASRAPSSRRTWSASGSTGPCGEGVTATDLVLTVTELLRARQGGGQVRRVLRRGGPLAAGRHPGHHRQHGARVRRHHGLLPDRRADAGVPGGHRPDAGRGARRGAPTTRRRGSSASRSPGRWTTRR